MVDDPQDQAVKAQLIENSRNLECSTKWISVLPTFRELASSGQRIQKSLNHSFA